MIEFHKIWIEQREAAQDIRERFGTEKALGYLIGEKLLEFVRASDTPPSSPLSCRTSLRRSGRSSSHCQQDAEIPPHPEVRIPPLWG